MSEWLSGLRVLDLTNVIAGPMAGQFFSRFGAEVIKIDPVAPQFDPWTTIGFGIAANRGKRSLLLDLKSAEGQSVLDRLLAEADVVLCNAVASQAIRLELTQNRLSRIGSKAILCRIDAFGGPKPGPSSEYFGYDDAVQAATGIMSRFGGSISTPEEHAHVGTIDVLCGFAAAFACGVALHARRRGVKLGTARTSLAALGQLVQLPFMIDYPGQRHGSEPSGPEACGEHALYRSYRTADGWMFVAGPSEKLASVMQAVGTDDTADTPSLVQAFAGRPTEYWQTILRKIGVEALPMRCIADWRKSIREVAAIPSEQLPFAVFQRSQHHPAGPVELLAPCGIRVFGQSLPQLASAPKFGTHSVEILHEIGCSDDEVRRLLRNQTVSDSWSSAYLPL